MPAHRRSPSPFLAVVLALLAITLPVTLVGARGAARAAAAGRLQQQISAGQDRISSLAGAVHAASSRLSTLGASISALQKRIARIQADLDAKRRELLKLRSQLDAAQTRLTQLEAYETHAQAVLAKQLVSSYEGDNPDIVTVVLEAHGFQDLLERIDFEQRVQRQDVRVVGQVKAARRAVAAQAVSLGALEQRQQILTSAVLGQRNTLAQTQVTLIRQQLTVARSRSKTVAELAGVRAHVGDLQHQLARIQAAQAAAAAAAAARARQVAGTPPATSGLSGSSSGSAASGGSPSSAPAAGAGGFVFPLPKGSASPPGSWSPDDGVDISAPGDTPEYAVCSGTVVLHGIGGFGPWAPVLHCDSPIDGYSYVYYGHAGPANQLPVGTHVSAGHVISSIGPGIVGISTGPHLEIGFCDSSGSPIGPSSAGTMMSLLQSAYGG